MTPRPNLENEGGSGTSGDAAGASGPGGPEPAAQPSATWPARYRLLEWLLQRLAGLPAPVLYGIARGICLLLCDVLRYRRRVVRDNLRNSFPEKAAAEQQQIARAFYWHFAQVLVEILMLARLPAAELGRRVRFTNSELMGRPFEERRLVLALGSHMGNWEWLLSAAELLFPGRAAGVYKPLMNPFFEQLVRRLRTRLGAGAVPMPATLRYLVRRRGEGHTLSLLTDQAAGPEDRPYWTTFLHQDTSFYTGADRLAAQFDAVVLYIGVRRTSRGHYAVTFTELPDGRAAAAGQAAGQFPVAEAFARQLERDLRATPEQYLWTHRRWKHQR